MGIYAQTHFTIECKNKKSAEEVAKKLRSMKVDKHGNIFGEDISAGNDGVDGFVSSGRIQNLEYKCEKIWETIKNVDGVIQANFPFLSEADGMYFEVTEIKPKDKLVRINR